MGGVVMETEGVARSKYKGYADEVTVAKMSQVLVPKTF